MKNVRYQLAYIIIVYLLFMVLPYKRRLLKNVVCSDNIDQCPDRRQRWRAYKVGKQYSSRQERTRCKIHEGNSGGRLKRSPPDASHVCSSRCYPPSPSSERQPPSTTTTTNTPPPPPTLPPELGGGSDNDHPILSHFTRGCPPSLSAIH